MARSPETVLCFGEALIDLIGHPPAPAVETERYLPRVGGAPVNVAVGLARLGIPVGFVGALGDDAFAEMIVERLTLEGIGTRHVVRLAAAQTRLSIVNGPAERRSFTFYGDRPADTRLLPEMVRAAFEHDVAAIYLSSLPLAGEPSRSALLEAVAIANVRGIPICFDPNPRWHSGDRWEGLPIPPTIRWPRQEILEIAEDAVLLKLSVSDLDALELTPSDLPALAGRSRLLALTDGARGCDCWMGGERLRQPAFEVTAVDETGAGDAFTAALIACGVESGFCYSPADLLFASAAGALATTSVGAMDALPRREQVELLVRGQTPGNS